MVDDGLVRYIKERLGEGYKEPHIRDVLFAHGHSEESVDEAFRYLHRLQPRVPVIPILIGLILVAGVAFYFFWPTASQQPVLQGPENVTAPPAPTQPTTGVVSLAEQLKLAAANQTPDETYAATVNAATTNAATAADGILVCSVNSDITYKDYCLQELAKQRKEPAYCEVIGDVKQRDDCYLQLILEGEDQYCSKLILAESKKVCDLLLGGG